MPGDQTKGRHEEMIAFVLAAMGAAEAPQSAKDKRLIRAEVMRVFGCSQSTAQRAVAKAARIQAGEPVGQWGGRREDAGAPKGNQNARRKPKEGDD